MNACITLGGALRCILLATHPRMTYLLADNYSNGYLTKPEEFYTEAERLKAEGMAALTFFSFMAYGSDVDTRVIDGNIVVQNNKILTLDEDAILDDVQQRYLSVAKRAGIKTEDFLTIWPVR